MLARCLADLAAQLRPADEMIVVDNGSTDDSAAVARAAGARVIEEPLRGIWPAAAAGYDAASGDIDRALGRRLPPPGRLARPHRGRIRGRPADRRPHRAGRSSTTATRSSPGSARRSTSGGYFWSIGLWLGHSPVFGSNFAMRRDVWRPDARSRAPRDARDPRRPRPLPAPRSRPGRPLRRAAHGRDLGAGRSSTWRGFGRRVGWAYRTLRLHLPEESPWRRRAARRRWQEQHADGEPGGAVA